MNWLLVGKVNISRAYQVKRFFNIRAALLWDREGRRGDFLEIIYFTEHWAHLNSEKLVSISSFFVSAGHKYFTQFACCSSWFQKRHRCVCQHKASWPNQHMGKIYSLTEFVLHMIKLKNNYTPIFYYFSKYTCNKMSQCKQVNLRNKSWQYNFRFHETATGFREDFIESAFFCICSITFKRLYSLR